MNHGGHAEHGASALSDDPVIRAYRQVNDKMHADMAIEFTGDADELLPNRWTDFGVN